MDAIVIGSGPNGLAAAIVLARAGRHVTVYEADTIIGGGTRTDALTLPGFRHDVCSAVHPMGRASPFFRRLPLADHGLTWVDPAAPLAHPFDDGSAIVVERSVEATAQSLGRDGAAYRRLIGGVAADWPRLEADLLGPIGWPSHPIVMARFGRLALQPASHLARRAFVEPRTRALFAGLAAHGMLPLNRRPTGAIALVLGATAHAVGWPIVRGGSQAIADALASYLRALGGTIVTGARVQSLHDLPPSPAVLCDLSPRPFVRIADRRLPAGYRRRLDAYRYGPAAFKVDFALDGPVPWRSSECLRAATVHLGGSLEEIEQSERAAWSGAPAERPFVLLVQPTLFDPSRAPVGRHVAWAYCHVPNGSTVDMLSRIEAQIERFAPGFRDRVLARHVFTPADLEAHNPNFVGGDIGAGASDLYQFLARPTWRHYRTPMRGVYLCSAATPPGVGVHGMCGYHAATRALKDVFGVATRGGR